MKKLLLVRHAKSEQQSGGAGDFERPLNTRGLSDAPMIGTVLHNKGISADCIIASPALRAKTTAQLIAEALHYEKEIRFDERIYEADHETLSSVIGECDDTCETLILVGHNPGISSLTTVLAGIYQDLPTCVVVEIDFDITHWSAIDRHNAHLLDVDYPKKHKL